MFATFSDSAISAFWIFFLSLCAVAWIAKKLYLGNEGIRKGVHKGIASLLSRWMK
jgi:hypothetical protein